VLWTHPAAQLPQHYKHNPGAIFASVWATAHTGRVFAWRGGNLNPLHLNTPTNQNEPKLPSCRGLHTVCAAQLRALVEVPCSWISIKGWVSSLFGIKFQRLKVMDFSSSRSISATISSGPSLRCEFCFALRLVRPYAPGPHCDLSSLVGPTPHPLPRPTSIESVGNDSRPSQSQAARCWGRAALPVHSGASCLQVPCSFQEARSSCFNKQPATIPRSGTCTSARRLERSKSEGADPSCGSTGLPGSIRGALRRRPTARAARSRRCHAGHRVRGAHI